MPKLGTLAASDRVLMDNAILFGVVSAALYGVTDLSRVSPIDRTASYARCCGGQGFLAVLLTTVVLATRNLAGGSAVDWTLLTVSSLAVVGGTGCLYYGLAVGRITVVSPLMACYGAVSALLAIATGKPITLMVALGLSLAVVGAILSATSGKATSQESKSSGWLPRFGCGTALWYRILAAGKIQHSGLWTASGSMDLLSIRHLDRRNHLSNAEQRVTPCGWKDTGLILGRQSLRAADMPLWS